jgi:hypothetical protein
MPLSTNVQLSIDGLHFILVIVIMLSHVVVPIASSLSWVKFAPIVVTLIQVLDVGLTTNLM